MDIGSLFVIIGVFFLGLRIALYKVGINPFDESPDKETKNLPQMVLMLLLAETFMLFGVYFITYPFQTYAWVNTTATSTTSNVPLFCTGATVLTTCGTTSETSITTTNSLTVQSTIPIEPSYQVIWAWTVAFIFTMVIILILFADGIRMLRSSSTNAFKFKQR